MDETTRTILLRARQILVEHGWTKGRFFDNGCYCLGGAVALAGGASFDTNSVTWTFETDRAIVALYAALPQEYQVRMRFRLGTVANWNDDQPSVVPVLALIDKVLA